jgi:L-iditol 2-dehydrogenase
MATSAAAADGPMSHRDGPAAGSRVAVDPARPCGHCEQCFMGNRNLCPAVRFAGHGDNDGGLQEFVAWPTELLHPVPDALSDTEAAMLEPLGVALHAMDLGGARLARTIVVVGCGPIGLCAVQLARAAGAGRVIAVERLAHRRDAAARLGADVVLDAAAPDLEAAVLDATRGRGVDLALEVAGNDDAVRTAIAAARPGGTVVLVGIPAEDSTTFPASVARRKGLTLKLSRRMNETYARTMSLVERGTVDVASLVTHVFAIDEVAQAFRTAEQRSGLKVVVVPGTQGNASEDRAVAGSVHHEG